VGDGGDTDAIEVDVPASELARRDLHLGASHAGVSADATADATADAPRTGPGRLRGTVIAADGGSPLGDVQVRVVDAAPTRTNARGEWTLAGVPTGTRVLEVRAPGFMPERRVVDVVDGAGAVEVRLVRLAAVLDTLRIVAVGGANLARSGFAERRRSSAGGRFYGPADLDRFLLAQTSDLFKYVPGLVIEGDRVFMRSAFPTGFGNADLSDLCVPQMVVNGMVIRGLPPGEVDGFVPLRDLAAVEVYRETQLPPQFSDGLSGCGSIVIWTK
jgi:hypothetical protein